MQRFYRHVFCKQNVLVMVSSLINRKCSQFNYILHLHRNNKLLHSNIVHLNQSFQFSNNNLNRYYSSSSTYVKEISKNDKSRVLRVCLGKNNQEEKFVLPYSWLRDVCQCSSCFNHHSQARTLTIKDFDLRCFPEDISVDSDSGIFYVYWNNGHKSEYPMDFLRKRNFTEEGKILREKIFELPEKLPWGKELQEKLTFYDFNELMNSDGYLLDYIETLSIRGLCFIGNSPITDAFDQITERVSYTKATNYGKINSEVKLNLSVTESAYTTGRVDFHTDLSFFGQPPGLVSLLCIAQDSENIIGGENLFVDALYCSQLLKKNYPEYYQMLTTLPVNYRMNSVDQSIDYYHLRNKTTLIRLDENGNFDKLFYSNQWRDTYLNIPAEKVDDLFKAFKKFDELLNENAVEHKLKPGEIVVFDNYRILHARNSYEVKNNANRHLLSWFWDWDEIYGRMRKLRTVVTGQPPE